MSENTEAVKANLGEAGTHLKQAAVAAGSAVKSAAGAAGDELRLGRAQVKSELADSGVAGLNAAPLPPSLPVVSIWSWHDSMVTPQTSSRVEWADDVVLSGIAHNALLNNREVWARVGEEIRKARADAASGVRAATSESPA